MEKDFHNVIFGTYEMYSAIRFSEMLLKDKKRIEGASSNV